MSNQSYLFFFFFFIPLHAMDGDDQSQLSPTSITCSGQSIPLEKLTLTELTILKNILSESPNKDKLEIKRALDKATKLIWIRELKEEINREQNPETKSYLKARLRTKQLNLVFIYPEYKEINELPVVSQAQRQRSKSAGTPKKQKQELAKTKSERSLRCKSPRNLFGLLTHNSLKGTS